MLSCFLLLPAPAFDDGAEILAESCVQCHSEDDAEGEFRLERTLKEHPRARGLFDYRRVRAAIETDAMPPRRKLDAKEKQAVLAFLDRVEKQALDLGGGGGQEPVRRLTRTELGRSLEALCEIELDIDAYLPGELAMEGGFEASSSTLFLHPEWLERAGAAARIALAQGLPSDAATNAEEVPGFLARFLRRAFRRPATEAEVEAHATRYTTARGRGLEHRDALVESLAAALASPHFLMRVEDPSGEEAREVSAFGLASRLSFFLWAAPPDDLLLDLAASDELTEDEVLDAQVTRMLADPRALSLGVEFAGQWLEIDGLGTEVKPDPIDVPFMTDSVMAAMKAEVAQLVHALILEGRPLDDLLLADFTFVTPELAEFYRWDDIEGSLRLEDIEGKRRGLLGKAAVLATTAYPDRTSPTLRGAWVLENLLGLPPPPPPPDASELDDELAENEDLTPRERLERHRRDPSCAACHDRIDPLGFALETFDRYGRSRRRYPEGGRIDDTGRLPGSEEFRGPEQLAQVILERHSSDLARQVSRRMLAYALGRPLTWEDEKTVVQLSGVLEEEGFGALVRAVTHSRPFRFQEPPR